MCFGVSVEYFHSVILRTGVFLIGNGVHYKKERKNRGYRLRKKGKREKEKGKGSVDDNLNNLVINGK